MQASILTQWMKTARCQEMVYSKRSKKSYVDEDCLVNRGCHRTRPQAAAVKIVGREIRFS